MYTPHLQKINTLSQNVFRNLPGADRKRLQAAPPAGMESEKIEEKDQPWYQVSDVMIHRKIS